MQRRHLFTAVLVSLATLGAGASFAAVQSDGPRAKIDANADGAIDRTEAAASPRLAGKFEQLDVNKDGRIAKDEMGKWGKHGGKRGGRGGIASLDADQDGRISQQEAAGKGRMAENFTAMDGNKDGYLVRSELRSYETKQRPVREAEMRKKMDAKFVDADLNKDGKLSRVEVTEKMPRLEKSFAWNDDNKDGFLSKAELEAGRGGYARR